MRSPLARNLHARARCTEQLIAAAYTRDWAAWTLRTWPEALTTSPPRAHLAAPDSLTTFHVREVRIRKPGRVGARISRLEDAVKERDWATATKLAEVYADEWPNVRDVVLLFAWRGRGG